MAEHPQPRPKKGAMSYFFAGLWHFAAAISFAVALGVITRGEPLAWLARPAVYGGAHSWFERAFFRAARLGEKGHDEVSTLSPARLGRFAFGAGFAPELAHSFAAFAD